MPLAAWTKAASIARVVGDAGGPASFGGGFLILIVAGGSFGGGFLILIVTLISSSSSVAMLRCGKRAKWLGEAPLSLGSAARSG